jgi:hypothetical protein
VFKWFGHTNLYKYNELGTWLGRVKQEVSMKFSWTILWTISKGLTHKMGEKNVDVRETDSRVVEEDVSGSKSCTMVVDTNEVLTFVSGDAIRQIPSEVTVWKYNLTAIL